MADRCPDCDAPLATQADYDATAEGEGADLCWREWNGDVCILPEVDWRARAMAAEEFADCYQSANNALRYEQFKAVVAREPTEIEQLRARLLRAEVEVIAGREELLDVVQAFADAQAMLEEIAAQRDEAQQVLKMMMLQPVAQPTNVDRAWEAHDEMRRDRDAGWRAASARDSSIDDLMRHLRDLAPTAVVLSAFRARYTGPLSECQILDDVIEALRAACQSGTVAGNGESAQFGATKETDR